MALIFISYSRKNEAFVLQLVNDLAQGGYPVWLDKRDIQPGQRWDMAIENALNSATHIIFVMSSESVQSNNVRDEVDVGLDSGKVIIPILTEDCDLPLRIRRLQYVDFRGGYDQGLEALVKHLPRESREHVQAPLAAYIPQSRETPVQGTIISSTRVSGQPYTRPRSRRPVFILASLGILVGLFITGMVIILYATGALQSANSTSNVSPSATTPAVIGTSGFRGHIRGGGGGDVPGVQVTFESEDGSIKRETVSDSSGNYQINLPIGRYRVTATHQGYEPYSTGSGVVVVTGSDTQVLDIIMIGQEVVPTQPLSGVTEIADPLDNVTPDFRQLGLTHTSEEVQITIEFSKPDDVEQAGHNVYLYGDQHYTISFNKASFQLQYDTNSDGLFDTMVFEGSVDHPSATSIAFRFPLALIPDISHMQVWAYSQTSKDRIPDSGALQTQ